MKQSLLDLNSYVVEQWSELRSYTETGYLKMEIPAELYNLLLNQRQTENLKWEECRASPYNNCLKIDDQGRQIPKHNVQVRVLEYRIFKK